MQMASEESSPLGEFVWDNVMDWMFVPFSTSYVEIPTLNDSILEVGPWKGVYVMRIGPSWMGLVPL
jgi:hypothetical protein